MGVTIYRGVTHSKKVFLRYKNVKLKKQIAKHVRFEINMRKTCRRKPQRRAFSPEIYYWCMFEV